AASISWLTLRGMAGNDALGVNTNSDSTSSPSTWLFCIANSVVASWALAVDSAAVGAVGVPINIGLSRSAFVATIFCKMVIWSITFRFDKMTTPFLFRTRIEKSPGAVYKNPAAPLREGYPRDVRMFVAGMVNAS